MRLALPLLAALVLSTPAARADVPPIDECSKEGSSCKNAGPDGKLEGVCKKASCTRYDPSTREPSAYECLRCAEGKAKRAGCASAQSPTSPGAAWLALAGLALVALSCRRR